jgi:DNA processing protein
MRITAPDPKAQDKLAWAALYWGSGLGPAGFKRLLARFGSARAALEASEHELSAPSLGLKPEQIQAMRREAPALLERLPAQMGALHSEGVAVVCTFEHGYPALLREAQNPPPVLCIAGEITPEDDPALAIVGTREPTPDGSRAAREVARACAQCGITVVSGLARGVDTAAHRGVLDAGGRTIAVLGSGIRRVHPRRNRRLARTIRERGALVSEQPPDASPSAARLMARNRLTSALARGVVAVESTLRGGTLQTARDAWAQGRLVFAIDWQADKPQAEGTRALIAQGAEPILGPDAMDLIEQMLREHQQLGPDQPSLL